jgi:feruloyl esterase
LVAESVNAACDSLDSLAEGVVNNYLACTARFNIESLRCTDGADSGGSCLSDPQLATLRSVYEPLVMPFPLAHGLTTYPGRLFGGEIQVGGEGLGRCVSNGSPPTLPGPLATDALSSSG